MNPVPWSAPPASPWRRSWLTLVLAPLAAVGGGWLGFTVGVDVPDGLHQALSTILSPDGPATVGTAYGIGLLATLHALALGQTGERPPHALKVSAVLAGALGAAGWLAGWALRMAAGC